MDWDLNTLRSLSTVFVAIAFAGVCWWAYAPKRKKRFDDAANLPFADEQDGKTSVGNAKAAKNDLGTADAGGANPGDSARPEEKRQD